MPRTFAFASTVGALTVAAAVVVRAAAQAPSGWNEVAPDRVRVGCHAIPTDVAAATGLAGGGPDSWVSTDIGGQVMS